MHVLWLGIFAVVVTAVSLQQFGRLQGNLSRYDIDRMIAESNARLAEHRKNNPIKPPAPIPPLWGKKPIVTEPVGTVSEHSLRFSWQKILGASRYNMVIIDEEEGKQIWNRSQDFDFEFTDPNVMTVTFPDIIRRGGTLPTLEYDKEYSFVVQAYNQQSSSLQSDRVTFTVTPISNDEFVTIVPELTRTSSTVTPDFFIPWKEVTGATSYIFSVKDYSSGQDLPAENYTIPVSELSDLHNPRFAPDAISIERGGIYGVWIRAEREISETEKLYTPWSKRAVYATTIGMQFVREATVSPSFKLTMTGPASPVSGAPVITWNPLEGASIYQIFIQNNATKATEKVDVIGSYQPGVLRYISYTPDHAFEPGMKYTVWVRAVGGTEMTAWSDPWTFTMQN